MALTPSEFLLRELRRRRIAAKMTQAALGEKIHFSDTQVSCVEVGTRPPNVDYLKAVDRVFGTGTLFVDIWEDLVKAEAAPVWLREWIPIEREAIGLRWYEHSFVPGLLQTEAYARATLAGTDLPEGEMKQRVGARLDRQSILDRDVPPKLFVLLDEMVLRRVCGDRTIMAEQSAHLAEQAARSNIHVQIVPTGQVHRGFTGSFIIAELSDGQRYGHLDHQLGAQLVSAGEEIATLSFIWDAARDLALTRAQSLDLLREAAQTWS